MTTFDHTAPATAPADVVRERLNDPAVAASLVTILDNAELLSTLVLGLSGFLERGDTIAESLAEGVAEMKGVALLDVDKAPLPSAAEIAGLVTAVTRATPVITEVLQSEMVSSETVEVLSLVGDAAAEGAARARESKTSIQGIRATMKLLKDPEVGRGLGLLVEIARALGRRLADDR